MMSVCLALPCVKGLMFCAMPSGLTWVIRSRPISATILSRKRYISWNFQRVSTCMTGNGSRPGKNALRARCSITAESLPMEYSITGLSNSAATSRMMWMLSASSSFRCVSLSTMATHEYADGRPAGLEEGATLARRPILIRPLLRTKLTRFIPRRMCEAPSICRSEAARDHPCGGWIASKLAPTRMRTWGHSGSGNEPCPPLGGIGAIDEQVFDREAPRQVLAQRLDTITLRGVMTGREEAQAILSRAVHRWLGDFASQVGIHARGYRLVDIALRPARAPAHATNRAVPFDHQRLAVQFLMHQAHEVHWCPRLFRRADKAHRSAVVRLQRPFVCPAEQPRQLHADTHVVVHVESQVIGEQADVVIQQGFQPALLHPDNARILVLPEVTVMHQHHIRLGRHRRIEHGLAGGHATDDAPYLRSPLDLQAV